ncbi:hypothetical protein ACWDRB_62975 [Nonomuraea sp. NPDC003707]
MKNRTALSVSNLGVSLCLSALACSVFSFEAKASNNARPDSRGMVIRFAVSARRSGQWRPKTAAVILESTAAHRAR